MTSAKRVVRVILVFSIVGVGLSIFSYLLSNGFTDKSFCVLGESFNCDVVNRSVYAKLFGIPVSVLGIIGYGFLATASVLKLLRWEDHGLTRFLLIASTGGLLFSLCLSSMEVFVIKSWCIVCIASQVVILSIFLMAMCVRRAESKKQI